MNMSATASAVQAPSSAAEFVEAVRSMLASGEAGAARYMAADGAARFPDHPWLKKTNRIINPKRIVSKPADAPDRTRELAWLREHGARYRDRWVALLRDELLASATELETVLREVRKRGLESKVLVHHIV